MGVLKTPLHVDCVMGVVGGIPPTARNLAAMVENIPGGGGIPGGERVSHWGVIGISRDQWMLVAAALTLGGSIRVGLEDNLYLPNGEMAKSNGELIAKARQMTEDMGRRPATVAGGARDAGHPRAGGVDEPAAGGHPRARPLAPAAGRVLLAAAGGLRRGRAEGRGHRHGRLHPLVAALLRGRARQRQVGAVPVAEPQQALDPPGPEERGRPRGAAAAGARIRRRARVLPPGRARPARRGLRADARGEPGDRLLRDLRLRPDRPQARGGRATT